MYQAADILDFPRSRAVPNRPVPARRKTASVLPRRRNPLFLVPAAVFGVGLLLLISHTGCNVFLCFSLVIPVVIGLLEKLSCDQRKTQA